MQSPKHVTDMCLNLTLKAVDLKCLCDANKNTESIFYIILYFFFVNFWQTLLYLQVDYQEAQIDAPNSVGYPNLAAILQDSRRSENLSGPWKEKVSTFCPTENVSVGPSLFARI